MSKYKCQNECCQAEFNQPGKRIEYDFNGAPYQVAKNEQYLHPGDRQFVATIEFPVCPYCGFKGFTEIKELDGTVQNVYVYELGTGSQTALDALLADGYVIVARYAKAYHLEKPKETQQ